MSAFLHHPIDTLHYQKDRVEAAVDRALGFNERAAFRQDEYMYYYSQAHRGGWGPFAKPHQHHFIYHGGY